MKFKSILLTIAPAALSAGAFAQAPALLIGEAAETAAEVGVLPEQKEKMIQQYTLTDEEHNPFAVRTKGVKGKVAVDTQSEESRIRSALESFAISGISKGGSGFKAQLGSIILSEGELIPRIIPGQTDELRVTKITPKFVEVTWVGDEEAAAPRQVTLPVDLEPRVAVMLPGANTGGGAKGQLVYLEDKDKADEDDE